MQGDQIGVTDDASGFFGRLPALRNARDTFEPATYRPAPDDWCLIVTDIENSTAAIAAGQHKTVNFVAATAIAALKNLCSPTVIPFLFGGDGAVVMVPADRAADARLILARARGLAMREFGLVLRVGLANVAEVRRSGCDVLVGRYEPSPGNSFGVFLGGGVGALDTAVKGRGYPELAEAAAIPGSLDDGAAIDLSGLSCRWDKLRSTRGRMLTLIIHGAADPGKVYANVIRIAAGQGDIRPVRRETLAVRWPPTGFMIEAHARRGRRPLVLSIIRVLAESALVGLLIQRGRAFGRFDPRKYLDEMAINTDFCKHDETISFVIDCPSDRIAAVREHLDACLARRELRYGMHLSQTALMTCLVTSATASLHIHFVDGGEGGYTNAAKGLKAIVQEAFETHSE